MHEPSERGATILRAIGRGPGAWASPVEVARRVDRPSESTTDDLADLHLGGWIEVWDRPDGPVVTLTPLAAERLGLRLVEDGRDLDPRWLGLGDPEPCPPRARNVCHQAAAANLDRVVDPTPSPLGDPRWVEPDSRVVGPNRSEPVRPRRLIGLGLTPWPGPARPGDRICPACGSRRLPVEAYCLYCDRNGREAAAKPAAGPPVADGLPRPAPPSDDPRRAAQDRQRRRARRRARHRRPGPPSTGPIRPDAPAILESLGATGSRLPVLRSGGEDTGSRLPEAPEVVGQPGPTA